MLIHLRRYRRHVALLAATLVALLAPLPSAACGAMIAREGTSQVDQERALIRWDGRMEDLVMEFTLQSGSSDAAQIEFVYTDPLPFASTAIVLLALLGVAGVWIGGTARRRHAD